jgi:hypothetical protein
MQMELGVPQILSLFLVVAGVGVIVLGFFKNFGRHVQKIKIERFGIDMELSTMGLWLVLGLILCAGGVYVSRQPGASVGPMHVRLNIHFDPAEVNPRNPKFGARAFMKTATGNREIPMVSEVREGALLVKVTVPNLETPFFIVFDTPQGTWKTDDHSVSETATTARKLESP